jgi:hypothetical protein
MNQTSDSVNSFDYGLGWCSFIPGLGIFLSIASIVSGTLKQRVGGFRLILLGLAGIIFNILFCLVILHGTISGPFQKRFALLRYSKVIGYS